MSHINTKPLWVLKVVRTSAALSVAMALVACQAPVSHEVAAGQSAVVPASAVVSTEVQSLPPGAAPVDTTADPDQAYRLGPSDVISVQVYLHPELSSPQPGNTPGIGGVMITTDGTVGLPLIGSVSLSGLTIEQAQHLIENDYGASIKDAHVTIQLIAAQSLRYYLLGAFSSPGVKYPGRGLTILDALSLGGSVDLANTDLYQAYVARGSTKLPIDFHALLIDGDLTQNATLESGDTVVIPPSSAEDVFVFGAVGKPGAVPFHAGSLSLLQALSVADLDLPNYTSAALSQIRIIRAHGAKADFIVVDGSKILRGEAVPFALQPGDIVFVPASQIANWNQALGMLLPSLTVIASALDPFVSIKYLSSRTN